jgi:diaminohydroxyphosphoribosylaminopyrimidine deaminase/5-amino-6-(5-phosphoribosylamino)uracil reductase
MTDERFMQMALELAAQGRGTTSPNPMVGAVVVRDGEAVGKGFHQFAGGPHAEVIAIDAAAERAVGATLYVTLEPCNHTGRTPPCTLKIIDSGIRRVVIGMKDPNPRVVGGGAQFLKDSGIDITLGVGADEARRLNEAFVKHICTGRPFVIAKCAATLDGRIATRTGDSKWITSESARTFVHELRHAVDAILVGAGTIAADDPLLTARLSDRQLKDPLRVILDTHLRISPTARVLTHSSSTDTLVIAGDGAPEALKDRITRKGVRVIEVETRGGRIAMAPLMDRLGSMGVTSVLIEGGSRVLASAFTSGVVDKVCFFYAPMIFGGDDGIPICGGPGVERVRDGIRLHRIETRRFGDDVMIEGYILGVHD